MGVEEKCGACHAFHGAHGKRCAGDAVYMPIKQVPIEFLVTNKPNVVKLVGEKRMFDLPAAAFPKNQDADSRSI